MQRTSSSGHLSGPLAISPKKQAKSSARVSGGQEKAKLDTRGVAAGANKMLSKSVPVASAAAFGALDKMPPERPKHRPSLPLVEPPAFSLPPSPPVHLRPEEPKQRLLYSSSCPSNLAMEDFSMPPSSYTPSVSFKPSFTSVPEDQNYEAIGAEAMDQLSSSYSTGTLFHLLKTGSQPKVVVERTLGGPKSLAALMAEDEFSGRGLAPAHKSVSSDDIDRSIETSLADDLQFQFSFGDSDASPLSSDLDHDDLNLYSSS